MNVRDKPRSRESEGFAEQVLGFAPVARLIARPFVLPIDIGVLSVAAALAMVSFYIRQTVADPTVFLALRISVKNLIVSVACWMVWSVYLWISGLYQSGRVFSYLNVLRRILVGVTSCTMMMFAALFFRNADHAFVRPLVIFWTAGLLLMTLARVLIFGVQRYIRPLLRPSRCALIVGSGPRAQELAAELPCNLDVAYKVVGFVDDAAEQPTGKTPVVGAFADLEDLLMREQIDEVFIALPIRSHYEQISRAIILCEETGIKSHYQADLFSTSIAKRRHSSRDGAARITLDMVHSDYRRYLKRLLDVAGAAIGLLLLAPLLIVIALIIKFTSEGPVIFVQTRQGLNKRRFGMYKFRSMVQNAEQMQTQLEHLNEAGGPVFKIKDDPRITRIGKFLRRTSLDEFPQLFNVLAGEMSLVGPRPLPMRDVGNFSELALMRRFSVKPGMTGLWQVSGRSDTKFADWIERDLEYIDNWSLVLDVRILLMTIPAVLRGSGAS